MSTQINVTVGSGGLPDKAKQQQQAARQAQLEKERQRRIEAEGAAQRSARLAAEGRNAQGQLLTGTLNGTPRPQDEPAAFRDKPYSFLFGPSAPPTSNPLPPLNGVSTGEDVYAANTNIEPPFSYQETLSATPFSETALFTTREYKAGEGPKGANAIKISPIGTYSVSQTLNVGYEGKYVQGVGASPLTKISTLNATDFTFEASLRLDSGTTDASQGTTISFVLQLIKASSLNYQLTLQYSRGFFSDAYVASFVALNYNLVNVAVNPVTSVGAWKHFAISRKGGAIRYFIDGVKVGEELNAVLPSLSGYAATTRVLVGIRRNMTALPPAVWLSRLKYTEKALYTQDFNPPLDA